jgi:hypothetical protein
MKKEKVKSPAHSGPAQKQSPQKVRVPDAGNAEEQLASFMAKFTPEIASLATEILSKMRRLCPTALELVYDNYNALAIGFGPTERASDAIFSIAVFPRWVSLFFLQAKGLPDPDKVLKGSGNVARHVVLPSAAALNDPPVQSLMCEASARAKMPFDAQGKRRLIIKSISPTQRPRRPSASSAQPQPQATRQSRTVSARKK